MLQMVKWVLSANKSTSQPIMLATPTDLQVVEGEMGEHSQTASGLLT